MNVGRGTFVLSYALAQTNSKDIHVILGYIRQEK